MIIVRHNNTFMLRCRGWVKNPRLQIKKMKHVSLFILALTESILFWPLITIVVMGCFVVFDALHIEALWLQILVVVSPLLVASFFVWRRSNSESPHESDKIQQQEKTE